MTPNHQQYYKIIIKILKYMLYGTGCLWNFSLFSSSTFLIFNWRTEGDFLLPPRFPLEMWNIWAPSNVLFNNMVCWGHCGFRLKAPELKMYHKWKRAAICLLWWKSCRLLPEPGNQTSLTSGAWTSQAAEAYWQQLEDFACCDCVFNRIPK